IQHLSYSFVDSSPFLFRATAPHEIYTLSLHDALPIWEAAVGGKLDRPEAFIVGLLQADQGRLAYLYDTIAELDASRARFALGLRSEEHTSELQSRFDLVCRLLLEKKKKKKPSAAKTH